MIVNDEVLLGDMILLGDTLRPRNAENWEGCAIGGVCKALGMQQVPYSMTDGGQLTPAAFIRQRFSWLDNVPFVSLGIYPPAFAAPDVWGSGMFMISEMFTMVCMGMGTIEQLAATVNKWQRLYSRQRGTPSVQSGTQEPVLTVA